MYFLNMVQANIILPLGNATVMAHFFSTLSYKFYFSVVTNACTGNYISCCITILELTKKQTLRMMNRRMRMRRRIMQRVSRRGEVHVYCSLSTELPYHPNEEDEKR
jgi:hypothetical protein